MRGRVAQNIICNSGSDLLKAILRKCPCLHQNTVQGSSEIKTTTTTNESTLLKVSLHWPATECKNRIWCDNDYDQEDSCHIDYNVFWAIIHEDVRSYAGGMRMAVKSEVSKHTSDRVHTKADEDCRKYYKCEGTQVSGFHVCVNWHCWDMTLK